MSAGSVWLPNYTPITTASCTQDKPTCDLHRPHGALDPLIHSYLWTRYNVHMWNVR